MINREELRSAVEESLGKLEHYDSHLFGAYEEEDGITDEEIKSEYGSRKLHEVCINHRLAVYLEMQIFKVRPNLRESLFVDIEFNRNGLGRKDSPIYGEKGNVRPDIIIHNRKSGDKKLNLLVVDCKKSTQSETKINHDRERLEAFILNPLYLYSFGLQVVYGQGEIKRACYLFKESATKTGIEELNLDALRKPRNT